MTAELHRDNTALAVVLDNQRVGVAVATREHLLSFAIMEVGKAGGMDARFASFRRGLERRLATFDPTHLAVVEPVMGPSPFVRSAYEYLDEITRQRRLRRTSYSRGRLRASRISGGRTYRQLIERLVARYPELERRFRPRQEIPGYRGIRTPHEAYNRNIFLAVAAAEEALADALLPEATVSSNPQFYEEDPTRPSSVVPRL